MDPQGRFSAVLDATVVAPLYRLQCLPRIQPLIQEDACDTVSILISIEGLPRYDSVVPANLPMISLAIDVEGQNVLLESINATKPRNIDHEAHISICSTIMPRRESFNISCRARIEHPDGQGLILDATSTLSYLPTPKDGSVTKLDRKTGGMLVKAASGSFEPIFPIGFYTDFGGYLATNLTILDELKKQGYTQTYLQMNSL